MQRDSLGRWPEHVALALWLGALPGGAAIAQEFPAKPVLLIAPFPAGGATDILARLLGEGMRPALGQQVLVQNVPGAGATIGVARVVQSPPTATRSPSATGRATSAPPRSTRCHGIP